MKLNKQEMTGGTKITLIISGAAMLAGIVIVVLFAAGALALSEQSRNVLAIAISAALVVFSYTLCKSLGVAKIKKVILTLTPTWGTGKGDILFHEREYPPFEPQRERFTLPALGLKNCTACGIGCLPWDGSTTWFASIFAVLCLRFVTLTQSPSTLNFINLAFSCQGGFAALAAIYALSVDSD